MTAMALNVGVVLVFAPARSSCVRVRSVNFKGAVEFDLRSVPPKGGVSEAPEEGGWGNYLRGAAVALGKHGHKY